MVEENQLLFLLEETDYLLEDILLSGFHSIQTSSLEKLERLKNNFDSYGMEKGKELLNKLFIELNKRRNSFEYEMDTITETFCSIEFYVRTAKNRLE